MMSWCASDVTSALFDPLRIASLQISIDYEVAGNGIEAFKDGFGRLCAGFKMSRWKTNAHFVPNLSQGFSLEANGAE